MSYDDNYRALHGALPPAVIYEESDADILSPGRGFMNCFDWTMQLQVGCPGGCLFCYVPGAPRLTPRDIAGPGGSLWGSRIRNKKAVGPKLTKHLQKNHLAERSIYWSGVTDPYAAPPLVTRDVWQILIDSTPALKPRRIAVQTRFRPDRDAALMAEYCRSASPADGGPPVVISYSVGTDRTDLIHAWERATPTYEQRLVALENLCKAGLFVVSTLSPMGPWTDLRAALRRFKSMGVAYITCLFFKECTTSANTSSAFLRYLREHHAQVLDAAWQADRIAEMREVYGSRVLLGKDGFASLANPMSVVARP